MKKLLIIFSLLITHCSLFIGYAQPVTQEWIARYQNPNGGNCSMQNMKVDKFGNVYVTGKTTGNGGNITTVKYNSSGVQQWAGIYSDTTTTGQDGSNLAVDTLGNVYVICTSFNNFNPIYYIFVKYNSNGVVQWVKKFNYNSMGAPGGIVLDKTGFVYITSSNDNTAIISKYNPLGDSLWVRNYFESGRTSVIGKILTNDSNLYMIGFSEQGFPLNDDYLTLKYDVNGNFKWAVKYTGPQQYGSDVPYDMDIDRFGNIIVTGTASSAAPRYHDYGTVKYNWNGVQQWAALYNGPGNNDDYAYAIIADSIGNIYVTGYANWGVGQGNIYTTIKYNSNGDSIWIRAYNSPNGGNAYSIKLDKIGNVYVSGTNITSNNNITTLKYSSLGDQQWAVTYPGISFTGGNSALFVDTNYNVYVAGTNSDLGTYDYILIKYSQILGINNYSNNIPSAFELLQNFPNPFNPVTRIKFSVPRKSLIQLKVYDVLGRITEELVNKELYAAEYEISFDGRNYSSGTYFYRMTADGNLIDTKKFVVLK
jgi:hypothetical protein